MHGRTGSIRISIHFAGSIEPAKHTGHHPLSACASNKHEFRTMSATRGLKAETVRTNAGGLWPGDKIKTELVSRGIAYPKRGKAGQVAALRELLAEALEKEARGGL